MQVFRYTRWDASGGLLASQPQLFAPLGLSMGTPTASPAAAAAPSQWADRRQRVAHPQNGGRPPPPGPAAPLQAPPPAGMQVGRVQGRRQGRQIGRCTRQPAGWLAGRHGWRWQAPTLPHSPLSRNCPAGQQTVKRPPAAQAQLLTRPTESHLDISHVAGRKQHACHARRRCR